MAEGDPQAEVRVHLVVDDEVAQATTRAIREGFEQIRHTMDEAHKSSESVAAGVFKGEAAFEAVKGAAELVASAVEQAAEFAHHFAEASLEAAEAQEQQERQMADFLILVDKGKHSFAELQAYTADTREEFARFGREGGYATKDLVKTYEELTQRGGMASEKAKELTEQIATVGKVMPGGSEAIARGFDMMERGAVSARNPLVQLIASTHLLQGNARDVAMQMKLMTPERQMQLGEEALARQAKLLQDMGANVPDLAHLRASFEDTKESFLEALGRPAMDALIPHLVALRDFLNRNAEAIQEWGAKVGSEVGDLIDRVDAAIEGLYEGVHQNWGELSSALEEVFGDWERAWRAGEQSTAGIKKDFQTIGSALVSAMADVARIVKAAAELAMDASDVIHMRTIGSSQAQVAAQAARGSVIDASPTEGMAGVEKSIDRYRKLAAEAGMDAGQVEAYTAALREQGQVNLASADRAKELLERGDFDAFSKYLQGAIDIHSEGAERYALSLVQESDVARHALVDGSIHIQGGFDALKRVIAEQSPELAKMLADMMNPVKAQGGVKPPPITQHFHGGVHIKQDFKDNDPDRVALVFRRDLAQAGAARTGSLLRGVGGFP